MMELPPRARRIRSLQALRNARKGTTSACAENTTIAFQIKPRLWNYLRVRGEYILLLSFSEVSMELPPRARRILGDAGKAVYQGGTTSACAENTGPQRHRPPAPRNYLRVRGEYNNMWHDSLSWLELPPRARRIQRLRYELLQEMGTTSACAENTDPKMNFKDCDWNYLRVRGEYPRKTIVHTDVSELPPRARRILIVADQL